MTTLPFRLQRGFLIPPYATFPEAPPTIPDGRISQDPVLTSALHAIFQTHTFPHLVWLKPWHACTPPRFSLRVSLSCVRGALPPAPSPGTPTFHATAGCPERLYQVWALPSLGAFTNLCYLVTSLTFRLTFLYLFYRVLHDLRSRIVTDQQEAFHQGDLLRRPCPRQEVEDHGR